MAKLDERGSEAQHFFYNLLAATYPQYDIVYEYPIGELGQRIDLFIPALGIAVEYDGIQHDKYNSFFFKDENAWNNSVHLDKKKNRYLEEKGVKVVRLKHNTKIKTPEELRAYIEKVPYPDYPYSGIEKESEYTRNQKKLQREKQKEYIKKQKERRESRNKSDEDDGS
jgi:hypothetical protein